MILNLRLAADSEVAALLAHPERIEDWLYGEDEFSSVDNKPFWKFWASSPTPAPSIPDQFGAQETDIDKAWHGLHYAFSGLSDEGGTFPSNFVLGGRAIGKVDVGYGPARCFTSEEVRDIEAFLSQFSKETLAEKVTAASITDADIYPFSGGQVAEIEASLPEALDYLGEYLEEMANFIAKAARKDAALIVYLN